jgi:sugar-phosphatase
MSHLTGTVDLSRMQAILLDMDGTLVDSDAAVERAWQAWAGEYGVQLAGTPAFLHGSPALRSVRRLRPDLDDEAAVAAAGRQLELQYDDLSDVRATLGTSELLAELASRQLPWAVVTSADVRLARARLGAAGVRAPLLVTAEDVRAGKPDPESYLLAARQLGADPGRCLVVEDSVAGVTAGQAAGATVAGLKGVPADLPIGSLGELADLIRAA